MWEIGSPIRVLGQQGGLMSQAEMTDKVFHRSLKALHDHKDHCHRAVIISAPWVGLLGSRDNAGPFGA